MRVRAFLRFFLAWYFPILGSMYFFYLLTGSDRISDKRNLIVPFLAVFMLYGYHLLKNKRS